MTTRKERAFLRRPFVLSLILGALAFIPSAPLSAPVVEAQGRPDLEAQHQRLLPLFELAGVVFTDADETRGRLVVGVLDRDVEGPVRGRLRALEVTNQAVDIVETDAIFALATLRDTSSDIQGGLQIRFSQFLCSLGFMPSANGEQGFVTASHCSDRQGAVDGTSYYQPSSQVPNGLIGNEIADPAICSEQLRVPEGKKMPPVGCELQPQRGAPVFARHDRSNERTRIGIVRDCRDPQHCRRGREAIVGESSTRSDGRLAGLEGGQQYVREHRGLGHEHRPSLPDVGGKHGGGAIVAAVTAVRRRSSARATTA